MTDNTLDNILSGSSETAPAGNEAEKEVTQTVPEGEGHAEQETEAEAGEQAGQRMVPHEALHAEKQKVKRYTDEVVDLRKSNETLQRQIAEVLQRIPVPKQETQQPPDFFDDPRAAVNHTVAPHLEQFSQQLLAFAKDNAITRFTEETVDEAEQAFVSALQSRKLDPADYQKVVNSPNRYAAAVQWHKRQQAQAEIGEDPAAYKARVEAEIKAKYGITEDGAAPANTQARTAVMPSNLAGARNVGTRTGPAWSGPQSIADIFKR